METAATAAVAKKRKDTRVTSEAVRRAHDARRTRSILTVNGISPGVLKTIAKEDFKHLDVDPAYQRGETGMVGQIINAIQAGGKVLDPVTLCRRTKWGNHSKLWIVDGYQRACAFQQMGMSFQAMVHESENLESEKNFFLALNARKGISADVIVKSWTGPSGKLIGDVAKSYSHPLNERVHFSQGTNPNRLSASLLSRGALTAAIGVDPVGPIQEALSRLDIALSSPAKRRLAEQYLQLMGQLFPKGGTILLVAVSFAHIAHDRFENNDGFPSMRVIERLRKVNWRTQVPSLSMKYRPVVISIINRIWKR
jgi:hypothetical protein